MKPLNVSLKTCLDYYHQKDAIFGDNGNSKWLGKGCKNFNLKGCIKRSDFLRLLQGKDPLNKLSLVKINKGREKRVCVDLPFSAPKSVSILAIHARDKRLIEAHNKSVEETINYIEKNYIYTRKTVDKITTKVKGGKATIAMFNHSTSRANDPHLHTHTLIMNMVKTKDNYKALCNDKIFRDHNFLASVYQNFLKEKVKDLGYKIKNKKNGWDIKGVEDKIINNLSKRRLSIQNEKYKNNTNGYKHDRVSFLKTRNDKNISISEKELIKLWDEQVDLKKMLLDVELAKKQSVNFDPKELTLKEKISLVTGILHETEASFSRNNLLKLIMNNLNMNINDSEKFVAKCEKNGSLICIKNILKKGLNQKIYSTPKMIEAEKNILNEFIKGKDKIENNFDKDKITQRLNSEFKWLTSGQKEAVKHILKSNNQFSIIQGDAGTGKTTSLLAVKRVIDEHIDSIDCNQKVKKILKKHSIRGMGFTGKSAVELETGSKVKSQTIHSFLAEKFSLEKEFKEQGIKSNPLQQLWVVDESSMVGSIQMDKLVMKAKKENAKLIFIGDSKQLQAIGAGKMFSELQVIDTVKTIKMNQVLRQRTIHMQKTVSLLKEHIDSLDKEGESLKSAFNVLDSNKCISKTDNITDTIVKDYSSEFGKNSNSILILCGDNKTKNKINEQLRLKLKLCGKIDKKGNNFLCKNPYTISPHNKFYARYYKAGTKAFINTKKHSGKEVLLKNINVAKNVLHFQDKSGNNININPFDLIDKNVSVSLFEEENKSFSIGEKVVFRKNDKLLNIQNGLTGIVINSDKGKLTILTDNKKKITVSEKSYAYLDYGYALTTHKAQGQTCDKVFYVAKDKHEFLNKAQNLYVAATRAKENIKIYTDNYDKIKKHFMKKQEKTTTLNRDKGMDL